MDSENLVKIAVSEADEIISDIDKFQKECEDYWKNFDEENKNLIEQVNKI